VRASWQHYGTYDESAHPDLWDGVVGYWSPCLGPTGTRLHDVSRYNNWGTLTNMDAATDWVIDSGQYALDFDGSNDYTTGTDRGLPDGNKPRTVSAWFKTSTKKAYSVIFQYGTNTTAQLFWMGLGSGGWVVVTQFGSAIFTSGDRADGKWHHLTVTQLLNTYNIFIDGASIATGTMTTALVLSGQHSIGSNNGASDYFNGQIDDAIVWSRALTPNEIIRLYQLGRGGMLERRRRRRVYSVQADAVKSYLFANRGQVIGGGTL
jgi:hypothetical protein